MGEPKLTLSKAALNGGTDITGWITVRGTRVPVGKDGRLMGKIGERLQAARDKKEKDAEDAKPENVMKRQWDVMKSFSVPIRLAVDEELAKAVGWGGRGHLAGSHKYHKRERIFKNGKLSWRYWYLEDDHKQQGKAHHDPHGKHEHVLTSEEKDIHPHLAGQVLLAVDATIERIKLFFGLGGKVKKPPKVTMSKKFNEKWHQPFITSEAKNPPQRTSSPMAHIQYSVETLIPDHIKELISEEGGAGGGLPPMTTFEMTTIDDESGTAKNAAGYMQPSTGKCHIIGENAVAKTGLAEIKYGNFDCPTITHQVVCHETGHFVHQWYQKNKKKIWDDWRTLSPAGPMITAYPMIYGEPTRAYEDWAESFSCALTHPRDLARKCPDKYEFMRDHVLPDLPELEVMKNKPDEEVAWWDDKPMTPAGQLLAQMKNNEPVNFDPDMYFSEKDQFYVISKDGKHIYMRFGPADKDEEKSWAAVPDTIDSETGLPKYEHTLGPRFAATGNIKEIFDEHGARLSNKQAYFYLDQFNESKKGAIVAAQSGFDPKKHELSDIFQTYKAWLKKGTASKGEAFDTHLLSKKMKDALGFAATHTQEAERARVKKKTAKGGDPVQKRHEWAPTEISSDQFLQKSGTFKFANMRKAKEQPWHVIGDDGNTVMRQDPLTGEQVPVLAVTYYEQRNPDGTNTQIRVSETFPFSGPKADGTPGDTIKVPMYVTRTVDGEEQTDVEWGDYTLQSGDPTDPNELALRSPWDGPPTTGDALLKAVGRYAKGQIMDPIFASLLNPSDESHIPIVIKDESDMQRLMMDAAAVKRRTWCSVSVSGGGTLETNPIAHIQLEWDGGGPPKVIGDYWARKMGKSEIRIDEFFAYQDEQKRKAARDLAVKHGRDPDAEVERVKLHDDIKIERVKINPPTRWRVRPGSHVWFIDPKSTKRVQGIFHEIQEQDGKTVYMIQAVTGKGGTKRLVAVLPSDVTALSPGEIPEKLDRLRRNVVAMEHDILLYMDEVPTDAGPESPEGSIRIMMPKDGSFTVQEMLRMPGIKIDKGDADEALAKFTLSPKDIPAFREHVGGFVMDTRVNAALAREAEQERMRKLSRTERQVISESDLVDEDGNIHEDSILAGDMVTGEEGMQPGPHRIGAMQHMANNSGAGLYAHFMGTGKTALAIAQGAMMRNLKDPETGAPHPDRVKGRIIHIVPENTYENWPQEIKKFTGRAAAVIGTDMYADGQKMYVPKPGRGIKETKNAFHKRVVAGWKEAVKTDPSLYNPWASSADRLVIGYAYFRDHAETLEALKHDPETLIDGMCVDEAHNIGNPNLLSKKVEQWMPEMKMFTLLTGTPITDTLKTIPRLIYLATKGKTSLPQDPDVFEDRYLVASRAARAAGVSNPPKLDINPNTAAELFAELRIGMHVAKTSDVGTSKAMPAVVLDENKPAHMSGQQGRLYRWAMAQTTGEDHEKLETSAALGVEEADADIRRKIAVARSISNNGAYKAPDDFKYARFDMTIVTKAKGGKKAEKTTRTAEFALPDAKEIIGKKPSQWRGKWPSRADVEANRVDRGYYEMLRYLSPMIMGVNYDQLEGTKIDKDMLKAVAKGEWITPTGLKWPGKVPNPDYGPEGVIARGKEQPDGTFKPIAYKLEGEDKIVETGKRFIRSGDLFFDWDDWDQTGRFDVDDREEDPGDGTGDPEYVESKQQSDPGMKSGADESRNLPAPTQKRGMQGPKEGREHLDVNRSVERREARAAFDAVMTANSAKSDELERWMLGVLDGVSGHAKPEDERFLFFANKIGSGVRSIECKMRQMGLQDVNEALGHPAWSSEADKKKRPTKYFVTYMGAMGTLGDRNLNSEMFRHVKDEFNKDTGESMFVRRAMYGTSNKLPKAGDVFEGWSRSERKKIANAFVDGYGRTKRNGEPMGMEMPMRVIGVEVKGQTEYRYVYESELSGAHKKEIEQLEKLARAASDKDQKKYEDQMKAIFTTGKKGKPYYTKQTPLTNGQNGTPDQVYVMNNVQVMVASDAANVGLNWPVSNVCMYDSLFSPMKEWQRITRSARLLSSMVSKKLKPYMSKVETEMDKLRADWDKTAPKIDLSAPLNQRLLTARMNAEGLMAKAIGKLSQTDQNIMRDEIPGASVEQMVEAFYAAKALDKIDELWSETENQLRTTGYYPDPDDPTKFHPPETIVNSDITNVILGRSMTEFERSMLLSRSALVNVKRLTTSADMPNWVKTEDGGTIQDPDQPFKLESPVLAERVPLVAQRAKMQPFEQMINDVRNAQPVDTPYDYVTASPKSLAMTNILESDMEVVRADKAGHSSEPIVADWQPSTKKPTKAKGKPKAVVPAAKAKPKPAERDEVTRFMPPLPATGRPLRRATAAFIQRMSQQEIAAKLAYHKWLGSLTELQLKLEEKELIRVSPGGGTDAHQVMEDQKRVRAKVKKSGLVLALRLDKFRSQRPRLYVRPPHV